MENYKVRVENIAEADHVQQLFENIGYKKGELINARFPKLVVAVCNRDGKYSAGAQLYYSGRECQELTIQQLRDLVVLHRNDVGDATHTIDTSSCKYFVSSEDKVFLFDDKENSWVEIEYYSCDLNPITKEKIPYLVKTIDKWEEQQLTSDTPESATCLKIPDGAIEFLYSESNNSRYHFVKSNGDLMSVTDILDGEEYWYKDNLKYKNWGSVNVVWQRPTQPEELPFIDDEPKMADIEQTLNERQSQYGDFSDVAETTQSLYLMLLNDDMTDVEREALHMICSKLSRIKHGDCHKIDSWHDIGGYATLVVKDLEQNNG